MAENTGIEWATHTWNPWIGCTKLSPACDSCYAETWAKRFNKGHLWVGERQRTSASNWQQPIKWNRQAEASGDRPRVFCASLADVFDNQVPTYWRDDLWRLIEQTPHLDWMLLTKRPQNIAKMLPNEAAGHKPWGTGWRNVWLGTTAEDQAHYRQRWPHIAAVPAVIRFLSYEPALGPIGDLGLSGAGAPDWGIFGGESGANARPAHPDWARDFRDQFAAVDRPWVMKQWGEFVPCVTDYGDHGIQSFPDGADCPAFDREQRYPNFTAHGREFWRVGKKNAGRLLDGVLHDGYPKVKP